VNYNHNLHLIRMVHKFKEKPASSTPKNTLTTRKLHQYSKPQIPNKENSKTKPQTSTARIPLRFA
jgi:hypothetical protein